jgi:hypothetical protein
MRKLILIILLAAFGLASLPGEAAVVNQGVSSSGKTWRTVSKKKHKHKKHQKRKKHKAHAKKRSDAAAK